MQSQIVRLGETTGGRFKYPVGKSRTQQHVEMMRQAEANLDAFCASVDQLMQRKGPSIEGIAVKKLLNLDRELQRTPEWSHPLKAGSNPANTMVSQDDVEQIPLLTKPFSTLYFSSETSGAVLPLRPPKTKVKPRRAPNSKLDQEHNEFEQNLVASQLTFPVDARAVKVFRTLFLQSSDNIDAR